jgi:hypothetical protein
MAIISSFCLFIVGVIGAAIARVLAEDFKEWTPFIVEKLIQLALSKLPVEQRERFAEEWRSHLNDVPGQIAKLWVAVGFNIAALTIADSRVKAAYSGLKRKLSTLGFHEFLWGAAAITALSSTITLVVMMRLQARGGGWNLVLGLATVGIVVAAICAEAFGWSFEMSKKGERKIKNRHENL